MRDNDPRPMPVDVKAAYRTYIDLLGLLGSDAYSDADRKQVFRALLDALIRDKGNVHFPHGAKQTRTLEQRASAIKDMARSIAFILSVPDYGGEQETLPYLARAMEPRWQSWNESQSWSGSDMLHRWFDVSRYVLGKRQFAWLAAQYARLALEFNTPAGRGAALEAIEITERWASNPNEDDFDKAWSASRDAVSFDAHAASNAAAVICGGGSYYAYASFAAAEAAEAFNAYTLKGGSPYYEAISRLCELTKWLITPSLIDAR